MRPSFETGAHAPSSGRGLSTARLFEGTGTTAATAKGQDDCPSTAICIPLAKKAPLPLEPPGTKDDAVLLARPCVNEGEMKPTRRDIRAITRRGTTPSGAALILGGLLLLSVP